MIVFDLICGQDHAFEGWFRSSADFTDQQTGGMLSCPVCGSEAIVKALMAPAVPAKGNQQQPSTQKSPQLTKGNLPKEVSEALKALAAAQAKALSTSEWVGDRFADEVRSMHYGEAEEKQVHGRATRDDAEALLDEGIAVAPLLVPVAPPDEIN